MSPYILESPYHLPISSPHQSACHRSLNFLTSPLLATLNALVTLQFPCVDTPHILQPPHHRPISPPQFSLPSLTTSNLLITLQFLHIDTPCHLRYPSHPSIPSHQHSLPPQISSSPFDSLMSTPLATSNTLIIIQISLCRHSSPSQFPSSCRNLLT